ncbi:MAG: response regulator [Deltaproteobacteria bacterium]|nr:response regulator [Deltaproteobacteria bacterium]
MAQPSLIWIVDDSKTQRAVTQVALGSGHRFEHFEDGASVLERLVTAQPPDLILMDWMMPGLGGDEICRFLRANPKTRDVAVILLTSRVESDDVVTALESGANDYVSKPFVPQVLRARVALALRASRLKREADLERRRVTTINELGRALFAVGTEVDAILGELASALATKLCDGCAVVLLPGPMPSQVVSRHRFGHAALLSSLATITEPMVHAFASSEEALAKLPATAASYIQQCGLRGLASMSLPVRGLVHGIVTVTRDDPEPPFDAGDLAAIQTCLELTGLAIEAAIRSEFERATNRFHEEMVGIVSHDLRTPLGAISSCVELLGDQSCDTPTKEGILGRIGNTTRRMTAMVDQLLDVTRTRLGTGIPVSRTTTGLLGIVADVLDEVRLTFRATTFQHLGEDVEGSWDSDRLGQAISNLASNAAQYGPPRGTVTVETSVIDDAASIVVRNENGGAPISEAQLRTMFDPFKRGDGTGHAKGLGLGLYIVQEIIRGHGGTVVATSDQTGTMFRILLPIEQSKAQAQLHGS